MTLWCVLTIAGCLLLGLTLMAEIGMMVMCLAATSDWFETVIILCLWVVILISTVCMASIIICAHIPTFCLT